MEIFGILDPNPHENLCGSETLVLDPDPHYKRPPGSWSAQKMGIRTSKGLEKKNRTTLKIYIFTFILSTQKVICIFFQCFGSGFRGLLNPDPDQGLKKMTKMLNNHNIYLLFSHFYNILFTVFSDFYYILYFNWLLLMRKSCNYQDMKKNFQIVLKLKNCLDPDSDFWLDPDSMNMDQKHWLFHNASSTGWKN